MRQITDTRTNKISNHEKELFGGKDHLNKKLVREELEKEEQTKNGDQIKK